MASAQPSPLAGWVYLGLVQTAGGRPLFGELMAPTGVRVTAYPGDSLMPGLVVHGLTDGTLQVACPPKAAPAAKQAAKGKKDSAGSTQPCVLTLRRGVPA